MTTPASAAGPVPDSAGDAEPVVPPVAPAPISCETAVRRLWDYLDGGLAAPAHGEVEAHLVTCAQCPPHFAFAARTLAALAAARPPDAAPEEHATLRARVRDALDGAA
jgi:anti-sigma factor RsiW